MPRKSNTLRRSVAIPRELLDEVLSAASPELRRNFNRLVIVSLRDFVARRKAEAFERAMAAMAADPAVRSECARIDREFSPGLLDGLSHD